MNYSAVYTSRDSAQLLRAGSVPAVFSAVTSEPMGAEPMVGRQNYSMIEVVNSFFNLEFRFKASEMTQTDYRKH